MREDLDTRRERWKSTLQSFQNTLWIDPPYPEHLYHYSSRKGIQGILQSNGMWLSDIRSMNDVHDGTYWSTVFRDVQRRKSVPDIIREPFERGDGVGIGTAYFSYLACFSSAFDLESQWNDYADNGRGCAIEFSFEAMRANADGGKAYAWTPMEYDEDVQWDKAERTVDFAIQLFRNERDNLTRDEADIYWTYAAFSYLVCGSRFKQPSYKNEKEWRVFISRPTRDGANHRPGAGGPIPYLTMPLAPDTVTGLIKGPACTCADDELQEWLNDAGYRCTLHTHRW